MWLLKREIRRNLEFLADKQVVTSGFDRKAYQYHLLRLTCTSAAAQIVNKFNVTPLKKRIMMMNKKRTSKMGLVKYALLFPVVGLLILSSNVQAIVQQNGEYASVVGKDSIVAKGIVMDADNKPLKNAIVVIRGTNIGTFTNDKGEFTITVKPGAELFFSYVGKKGQLRDVKDEQKLVVKMQDGVFAIDDLRSVSVDSTTASIRNSNDIFQVVESMPQFPGDLNKYLGRNVKYPEEAQKQKIQGRVTVQFIIEKDGTITGVTVLRSVHPLLDKEAIRVVQNMPKWVPGTQRGEPVRVSYTAPINFRLN